MNVEVDVAVERAAAKLLASASAVCKKAAHMQDGDSLYLEGNAIKKNKELVMVAQIVTMGTIELRHGKDTYGASGVVIDEKTVRCYNYTAEPTQTCAWEHGLSVRGTVGIHGFVGPDSTLQIRITAGGKISEKKDIPWIGTRGGIELASAGTAMEKVIFAWDCADYSAPVWMFGDSYFTYYEERWPYYLVRENKAFLLCGFPGAMSSEMFPDFRQALEHGTPPVAVWCLGMNDPDADGGIDPEWKMYAEQFTADCRERGIVPVLCTVPNVPDRVHVYKNEYVRTCGCRYIDFASAVDGNEEGSGWAEGMLSADRVHPAVAGARALAAQVLLDLPEIRDLTE